MQWTEPLEKCHAQSLNAAAVTSFFKVLGELIEEHHIPIENIYNADEKGVQLGLGKKVFGFFSWDQKDIYNIEDGDCELVTMIKTICANGTALAPSAIFKGK
jgi:hypothetical protein